MTKASWEIRDLVKDALHSECPNCGGYLVAQREYRLRCQDCGMDISMTSKNYRIGFAVVFCAFSAFVLGAALTLIAVAIA